jgi:hypothetical protein
MSFLASLLLSPFHNSSRGLSLNLNYNHNKNYETEEVPLLSLWMVVFGCRDETRLRRLEKEKCLYLFLPSSLWVYKKGLSI